MRTTRKPAAAPYVVSTVSSNGREHLDRAYSLDVRLPWGRKRTFKLQGESQAQIWLRSYLLGSLRWAGEGRRSLVC